MTGLILHPLRLAALDRLKVLRVPFRKQPPSSLPIEIAMKYPPPYAPGDYFVRETWTTRCPIWDGDQRESFFVNAIVDPSTIIYRADDPTVKRMWRSSVTMPEWASRYLMTLGPPVPCRLGEVTMEIAIAEGWDCTIHCDYYDEWYLKTWSQIYGKKHPWSPDLWTWGYPVTWRKR